MYIYPISIFKGNYVGIKLVRTTIRILPRHEAWLEATAKGRQRALAEVLRDCVAATLQQRGKHMETYASGTKPKAVYLAKKQLDLIVSRCKSHGGTMSGLIRHSIDEQIKMGAS